MVGRIFRIYEKITGGADASVAGLNSSIRPLDLVRILGALEIQGREFIDFGAGDGRVLLSAILGSATKASGYELPENKAHRTILLAVLRSIEKETDSGVEFFQAAVHWIGRDYAAISIGCYRYQAARPRSRAFTVSGLVCPFRHRRKSYSCALARRMFRLWLSFGTENGDIRMKVTYSEFRSVAAFSAKLSFNGTLSHFSQFCGS